jgi:SHS2 domain-containing protein
MSDPFEIIEHTADTGFRAWGATPAELFENAARAMLSIAAESEPIQPAQEVRISVEGADYPDLLVNWLSEILYLFDSGRLAAKNFHVEEITASNLRAVVRGEPREDGRHPWKLIIKAVTYHEIEVAERNGRWECKVYVDI